VRNFSQLSGAIRTLLIMSGTLIGYARCSTDEQDLTAQRDRLAELGVAEDRVYLDHGLTGTTRARPGLDQALAAVREGDTLIVTKLDRLARSVPDARAIGDQLAARGVKLSLGGQVYDPTDPMGKMFYSILAIFAEFEVDLLRARTKEGMAVMAPASTPSPTSPTCSPSPAPPCTAPCADTTFRSADPPTVQSVSVLFTPHIRPIFPEYYGDPDYAKSLRPVVAQ
jgi:hypothetical protein